MRTYLKYRKIILTIVFLVFATIGVHNATFINTIVESSLYKQACLVAPELMQTYVDYYKEAAKYVEEIENAVR
jgi:hypothetical protein